MGKSIKEDTEDGYPSRFLTKEEKKRKLLVATVILDESIKKYVDSINNIPGIFVCTADKDFLSLKLDKKMEESLRYFLSEIFNVPGIVGAFSTLNADGEILWEVDFINEPGLVDIVLVSLCKYLTGLVYDQPPRDFYRRSYKYEA